MSRMRASLAAGPAITVGLGDVTLFRYGYGAPLPRITGLRTTAGAELAATVAWTPPHARPGAAVHDTLTELSATATTATIAHHLRWAAVDEWRSLTTSVTGDAWLLLFENTITNVSGRPLPLTGTPLSLRAIAAPPAGRSEWQAATDPAGTLVVVDDTANLQHPPRWSAGLRPEPFGAEAVTLGIEKTIAFRYAVVAAPPGHPAPALAAAGRDALIGRFPAIRDALIGRFPAIRDAARGPVCGGEHTRRGPVHRTRARVLTRQCESRGAGTPPTA
jgi:hypothetical protein